MFSPSAFDCQLFSTCSCLTSMLLMVQTKVRSALRLGVKHTRPAAVCTDPNYNSDSAISLRFIYVRVQNLSFLVAVKVKCISSCVWLRVCHVISITQALTVILSSHSGLLHLPCCALPSTPPRFTLYSYCSEHPEATLYHHLSRFLSYSLEIKFHFILYPSSISKLNFFLFFYHQL